MKNKKLAIIYACLIMCAIYFVSIGFSAYEENLIAKDISATVRVNADIRITDIKISDLINGALSVGEDYNKSNIFSEINLPNADSEVKYNISITNIGDVEMGLSNINGLPDNLTYEINGLNLGESKICENNSCKNGVTQTIELVIKYKEDGFDSSKINYSINLDFDFKCFLDVEYDNSIKDFITNNNPSDVMYGSDLKIDYSGSMSLIRILIGGITYNVGDELVNPDNSITTITSSVGKVIISNVRGGVIFKYEVSDLLEENTITKYGVTIHAKWYSDNSVEFTLNGTLTSTIYARLRQGDLEIADEPTILYKKEYSSKPLFKKGDNIYLTYEYLSGDISGITKTFTMKFRDTTTKCNAINDSEYITNHSKANFELTDTTIKTSTASTNISSLSIFSEAGNTFDNFKYRVTYGYQSELNN